MSADFFRFIEGYKGEIEFEVSKLLSEGWLLHGPMLIDGGTRLDSPNNPGIKIVKYHCIQPMWKPTATSPRHF